jgi:hypothetical protein
MSARLQHAMEVANLVRARAVCGLDLSGRPRKWAKYSQDDKRLALRKLDREFEGADWAYGKMSKIFLSMLREVVTDNNRRNLPFDIRDNIAALPHGGTVNHVEKRSAPSSIPSHVGEAIPRVSGNDAPVDHVEKEDIAQSLAMEVDIKLEK